MNSKATLAGRCAVFVALLGSMAGDASAQQPARDSTRRDGLTLASARTISFETSEGTWMNLDVSPDGSTLVFDLLGDVYTLPMAGGRATRITSGMAYDIHPVFSPDGKRIAYISDASGSDNIWT